MKPLVFESLYYGVFLGGFIVLLTASEMIDSLRRPAEPKAKNRDRGSYLLISLSLPVGLFLGGLLAWNFPNLALPGPRVFLFWLGIGIMIFGAGFRWYAIRVLGKFFTRTVKVRKGQKVVEDGPYKFIRHPAYTGVILTLAGIGVAMGHSLALLSLLVFGIASRFYRVLIEEKALSEGLGKAYKDYMLRTKRFIPFIW
ncbi:MAG: isoprenylcysteine carboxylmethyltransferase family protein [Spirochaetia bacterium]|nr:isoprenylcysteine carboxylmethyltransferase family protein [Spirochaetia bacterium]